MPACLLGLGSNVGDREATLATALKQIDALPDVRLLRQSQWYSSRPIGGPPGQGEFLNAAATFDTSLPPLTLLDELHDIESRHGRQHAERWAPRTLDIDLLLYGNEVAETEMLTLPHPRMSFRRFVLQPAVEVAPRMLHPVIGWPVERLLLHLDAARDQVAIVSPAESLRRDLAARLSEHFAAQPVDPPEFPTAQQFWPPDATTWLDLSSRASQQVAPPAQAAAGLPYAAAAFPKLTILLDARSQGGDTLKPQWSALVRRPGRGPTLRLQHADLQAIQAEVFAAFESIWPI